VHNLDVHAVVINLHAGYRGVVPWCKVVILSLDDTCMHGRQAWHCMGMQMKSGLSPTTTHNKTKHSYSSEPKPSLDARCPPWASTSTVILDLERFQ
jgi:hypothetical protein